MTISEGTVGESIGLILTDYVGEGAKEEVGTTIKSRKRKWSKFRAKWYLAWRMWFVGDSAASPGNAFTLSQTLSATGLVLRRALLICRS